MSKKITIEMEESYSQKLDILRKVFVWPEGKELTDNGMLLQGLTDTFMEFLQNQPTEKDWHVHWPDCNH